MKMRFKVRAFEFWVLAVLAAAAVPAHAGMYPDKPIRVISDSAPGSAVDVAFRIVMDRLGKVLGQ